MAKLNHMFRPLVAIAITKGFGSIVSKPLEVVLATATETEAITTTIKHCSKVVIADFREAATNAADSGKVAVVMSRVTITASLPVSIVSAGTPKINVFRSLVIAGSHTATAVTALQT